MRGIISGAMLAAIKDLGYGNCFDAVYASSAGAINGAYFISGDGWPALTVYYDELIGDEFFAWKRILKRQAPLSLDFVLDDVMETRHPLRYDLVLEANIELCVIVTSVTEMRWKILRDFRDKESLCSALRASASVPLVTGAIKDTDGDELIDGSTLLAHPALAAMRDDYTHVVVLRTKSKAIRRNPSVSMRLSALSLETVKKGLGPGYLSALNDYRTLNDLLITRSFEKSKEPYLLDISCPIGGHSVG